MISRGPDPRIIGHPCPRTVGWQAVIATKKELQYFKEFFNGVVILIIAKKNPDFHQDWLIFA